LEIPEVVEHEDKNARVEEKKLALMLQRIRTESFIDM
jgi:hypothetical protein